MRRLFIISDLHLGGRPDERAKSGGLKTGFQICNSYPELINFIDWLVSLGKESSPEELELVINGDIVDFLAEDDFNETLKGAQIWTIKDKDAVTKLNQIAERTRNTDGRGVFEALKDFLAAKHRLTLILGNHDIELSLPAVRARLVQLLGGETARLRFLYDGEAYTIGRVLIEHGNRYDRWNMIGHSGLRQERSMRSRGLPLEEAEREERYFIPPAGTYLVIHFMNRIKARYRFIDLLKPEDSSMIPLLLALEPGRRKHLKEILNASPVIRNYIRHGLRTPVIPQDTGDLEAREEAEKEITLREILEGTLGEDAKYFGDIDTEEDEGDLAAGCDKEYDEDMSDIVEAGAEVPSEGAAGIE
ncbi:MAG TPA: metallophosphoesterase, partial [Pyrinomonadaceae bacterium]|nr:metallophosphoesterase [Pyrinomonadaceae bacterium]